MVIDRRARPAAVTLAPTGMIPTKVMTPHVPVTPAEVAADVAECMAWGVTTVHLHARDADGRPDWRRETFRRFIGAVRDACPEVLICVSTSGRDVSEFERRADVLALDGDDKPDLASLALSSMNFVQHASVSEPEVIRALAQIMRDRGIIPELEIFDLGMANYVRVLERAGLIEPPFVANLFVGNIAGAQATPSEFGLLIDRLPSETIWNGAGIGDAQPVAQAWALFAGGGVRVGLEDGIWLDRHRARLARNADLVERVHRLMELAEREIANPEWMRKELQR